MTRTNPSAEPLRPFGADPARSPLPAIFWSVVFAAWIVFLLVMAILY